MKQINYILVLIGLLLSLSSSIFGQIIEWEYEISHEKRSVINYYWEATDELKFNINAASHDYLLSLDRNGKLNKITYLRNCSKSSDLLPFKDGKLLSFGRNCPNEELMAFDIRLYSQEGLLKKKDQGLGEGRYTGSMTSKGYYLACQNKSFEYKDISTAFIDWNFNISKSNISIKSLRINDSGIKLQSTIGMLDNNLLVTAFKYVTPKENNNIKLHGGVVIGTKDDKIQWQYPIEIDDLILFITKSTKKRIGLVRWDVVPCKFYFDLLDENGSLINTFQIKGDRPSDIILQQDTLFVLFPHHISAYNYSGEFLEKYEYDNDKTMYQSRFKKLDDDGFLIKGFQLNNKSATIRKVNLQNSKNTNAEQISKPIKSFNIDKISEENLSSINVFPNPASIYINFKIEGETTEQSRFKLEVISKVGQLVLSMESELTEFQIDISNFRTGQYYYKVIEFKKGESKVFSGSFVKIE